MDFIVELRNIHKSCVAYSALADFSVQVRRGEFLTLPGPSGRGKTIQVRLVAGFEQPLGGQVMNEGTGECMIARESNGAHALPQN